MPTTSCHSCGLPRADELLAVAPCPLCGADALPVAEELPAPPRPPAPPVPPQPVSTSSRFGLGLVAGLLIGTGVGAGAVVGWRARPTPAPEVTAAPADPAPPPPVPPKSTAPPPDPPPPPAPAPPAIKGKPNPFRPTGPPAMVLDNPDGETRPVVRPGGHLVLAGKVKRLVIPGLQAGAVLDAAQLEAGEVVVAGPVSGRSRLVVHAPGGVVRFRGPVDGGSVAGVTGRAVAFDEPIGGAGTRVSVTLTSDGELTFATISGPARLEYRRANPNDPTLRVTAGRVVPPAVVAELP
ncbi:hypothetical protein J0H58_30340 [bacterium]|nr:hypothetical protein [bacterium]